MAVRRLFYVTQDALQVWEYRRTAVTEIASFAHGDDGFQGFSEYLAGTASEVSLILVDVIEEEFYVDAIPPLGIRDRQALIERRVLKKFPRTPFRLGQLQGKSEVNPGKSDVLYSAVSNPELLDAWLKILQAHKTPLLGIYSVPLLGSEFLKKFGKPAKFSLLLGTHQENKLRQTFLINGKLKSSRLSKSSSPDDSQYAEKIVEEIQRSRRYLERGRLLTQLDELHIYLVADAELAHEIAESAGLASGTRVHAIDPQKAASSVGIKSAAANSNLEVLYLALSTGKRPRDNYSLSGETHYNRLMRVRQVTTVTAVAASLVCSAVSGIYLADGLQLRSTAHKLREQVSRLEETYRRENQNFQPLKADSQEMKVAVDTGDYIVRNSVPVSFVMQQLGLVIGDFPDMHLNEVRWETASDLGEDVSQNQRRRDKPMPVAIPRLTGLSAELSGQILPYDGDIRAAFQRIRDLAAALESKTRFASVRATEFPINDSPLVPLSGEVLRDNDEKPAKFRLQLTLELPNEQNTD